MEFSHKVLVSALLGLICTSTFGEATYAKTTNQKTSSKKSKPKGNASLAESKPKTVADLLKNIEKKSQKVEIKKSQSSLPSFQVQTSVPNKVNLKQVQPPKSTQLYYDRDTDEAQLMKVTDEGIEQLYSLTQRYTKSAKRGELWLRLAEMYVEKARLIEYQLMNRHDANLQAHQSGKLKKRPVLNLEPAYAYNKKAIQLYEWFLRDFPKDSKVDQALFFLGYNYFELNDTKKGEKYYVELTKNYPNSMYVSESNFALGEFHFENEKWNEAMPYYAKASSQKSNRLYSFAMYKLSWCYYKTSNTKKALNYLEQVILEGRKSKGSQDKSLGGVSRIRLATEAIKDLIIFYAEAGDPKMARSYFESIVGEKSTNANLAKLAYYYSDTDNRTAATEIFRDLIEQDPNAVKAYDYQYAIVKMHSAAGASPKFKIELFSWIDQYGPGSHWQEVNAKDVEAVKKANDLMETLLRNHVLQQHQIAQNSRTKSAQIAAKEGYSLYFKTFSKSVKIDEMHFFFAELLFDLEEYDKAAVHYVWVVDNASTSQYYDKALLNSLLSFEKRLPSEAKIKDIVGEKTEPIEFDGTIKDFEVAAFRFLDKAPKSENAVAVKYRLGSLNYLFNQFNKAIPLLNDIIKNHPKTPYAKFAANHLLDIYNIRKDYEGLQQAANSILSIPELERSEVGSQIKDIKLKTDFKLAKALEDDKDFSGSAKAYEEFAMKNKASGLASAALFNSAVNYEKAGDVLKAMSTYMLILGSSSKGNEEFKSKASKFLPPLYEKTGQYLRAAQLFEGYAKANPKDPVADEYFYNAAAIYDGMNSSAAAIRNYEAYFEKNRSSERFETLFLVAKIHERFGRKSKAIASFEQYLKSGTSNGAGVVEAHYTIAKLHESMGRKALREEWCQKTISVQKRLYAKGQNAGISYAAECKFKQVYNTYLELVSLRIPANPAQQGAVVQKKLALVNRLKSELALVIAYDDASQIVAALATQGKALHHLYSSITAAPIPKGLKPDELKQYQEGVAKIAEPFKSQAIEVYQSTLKRAYELQGYNEYLLDAAKNLNILEGKSASVFDMQSFLTFLPDYKTSKSGEFRNKLETDVVNMAATRLAKDADDLDVLNDLGVYYFEGKKPGLAKMILKRALKAHPKDEALYNNLAVVYLAENDMRLALENLRKSLEMDSSYRIGATNLSSIYLKYRDFERSMDPLESAYQATKSDLRRGRTESVEIANNYGVALTGIGSQDKAGKVFEEIASSDARNPIALLNYAIFLIEVQDKKKDAIRLISKLKFMTESREILQKVEALEKKLE